MKRLFLIGVMILTTVAGFAQNRERIDTLKEQQKVLKMTTELNKLQLDYEKEKANNVELSKKAADINVEANIATTEFNTTNASSTGTPEILNKFETVDFPLAIPPVNPMTLIFFLQHFL